MCAFIELNNHLSDLTYDMVTQCFKDMPVFWWTGSKDNFSSSLRCFESPPLDTHTNPKFVSDHRFVSDPSKEGVAVIIYLRRKLSAGLMCLAVVKMSEPQPKLKKNRYQYEIIYDTMKYFDSIPALPNLGSLILNKGDYIDVPVEHFVACGFSESYLTKYKKENLEVRTVAQVAQVCRIAMSEMRNDKLVSVLGTS